MEDRCVCCGVIIPEGRMVCPLCEAKADKPHIDQRESKPQSLKRKLVSFLNREEK